jgi:putative addiction module killer protein
MDTIEIINYKTVSGKEPFIEWLNDLESTERAIIRNRLNRVRSGNFGDCWPIKGSSDTFEFRFDRGPGYRIYFYKETSKIIILLMGGIKRTQDRDIEKAKRYQADYIRNKE